MEEEFTLSVLVPSSFYLDEVMLAYDNLTKRQQN